MCEQEGFSACRSHIGANAIKTNCPIASCIDVARDIRNLRWMPTTQVQSSFVGSTNAAVSWALFLVLIIICLPESEGTFRYGSSSLMGVGVRNTSNEVCSVNFASGFLAFANVSDRHPQHLFSIQATVFSFILILCLGVGVTKMQVWGELPHEDAKCSFFMQWRSFRVVHCFST